MLSLFLVAAAMASSVAGTAVAEEGGASGSAVQPPALERSNTAVPLDRKVCVKIEKMTGSRIAPIKCRTYREWLQRGEDPFAKES